MKLFNFGFAKELYEGQNERVVAGTRMFMVPVCVIKSGCDEKVDIWTTVEVANQ